MVTHSKHGEIIEMIVVDFDPICITACSGVVWKGSSINTSRDMWDELSRCQLGCTCIFEASLYDR